MNIAIDIAPLKSGHYLQHRVRGTGFYLQNLQASLRKYYPGNKYIDFNRGDLLGRKIDVVHYPYFEPFFLSLPVFNKYKTAVTVHDLIPFVFPEEFPSGLKGKIKWQIQKFALRNARRIITDSASSKRDIVKFTGISRDKISVVYLAASDIFKPKTNILLQRRIRAKYKLPEEFVLYVGDVTWNKNLPRLIAAVKKAKISMVMVGGALVSENTNLNNPWNKDLVQVRKLIEEDRGITALGFIPKEDLVLLYNMAAVLAIPSLYEGFGLPILEAMSCGCPVATSKAGSIPEVAGDAAFYVDPYDISSIANGIKKIFFDRELQKELSTKGFNQAKKFSWKKTAEGTVKVYESVVK